MTTIQAKVPDYLARLAREAAAKEPTTVDNIVSIALAAHVGAWQVRDDLEVRAPRATSCKRPASNSPAIGGT